MTWKPLVRQLPPPALPVWDPLWNLQCLQCKHVDAEITLDGVQVLRCMRTKPVGGGGKQRPDLRAYCIDTIDEECKTHGWHEPKDA